MIEIKNWPKFQHYKNRRPPWIKLHDSILDSAEWASLDGDSAKVLIELWLTAGRDSVDGKINMDSNALAWRLRRDSTMIDKSLKSLELQGFVSVASGVLADCKQSATPETEGETKRETKERERQMHPSHPDDLWSLDDVIKHAGSPDVAVTPDMAKQCFDHYNAQNWTNGNGREVAKTINQLKSLLRKWKVREPSMGKTGATQPETQAERVKRLERELGCR